MLTKRYLLSTLCLFPLFIDAQGLINQNAQIVQNGGSIVTKQHLINNGKFTQNKGTFVFAGTNQQLLGNRAIPFKRVYIATGSNTVFNSNGHSIKTELYSDGQLNANNHLTLLADNTNTALVNGAGSGSIIGSLTVQAYLANGYGYKYLGSPFQNAIVNNFSGFVNLYADFPSVYQYDESLLSNGWVKYNNSSNTLEPMRAYAFQLGSNTAPNTISLTGVVNNGNINLSLSNNNQPYTKGFHLVSNPYPSPINWDALSGWNKMNIDNAIYYFDSDQTSVYTGVYNSYINGISSNGIANNIIPAMQGFFIHVADGTYPVLGNLQINNTARIATIDQNYRKINQMGVLKYVRLSASLNDHNLNDHLVLYLKDNASNDFNNSHDAIKLMNTSVMVPNVFSYKNNQKKLSIHSFSLDNEFSRIPIAIEIKEPGTIHLKNTEWNKSDNFPYLYLYDDVYKVYRNLQDSAGIHFQLPAGIFQDRFYIVFNNKPIEQASVNYDSNGSDGFSVQVIGQQLKVELTIPRNEKRQIMVTDIVGHILFKKDFQFSGIYIVDLPNQAGVYFVSALGSNKTSTKKIIAGQ